MGSIWKDALGTAAQPQSVPRFHPVTSPEQAEIRRGFALLAALQGATSPDTGNSAIRAGIEYRMKEYMRLLGGEV